MLRASGGKLIGNRKWIAATAAAGVLLSGIGWYIESPIYTLEQLRDAANANDSDRISSYVDYPSLRESLKSQIMARVRADIAKNDRSGLGSLEGGLVSAFVGPLTDAVVSPSGVRVMLLSRQRAERLGNRLPRSSVQLDSDPVIERHGLSEFDVTNRSKDAGALVFKRHGLGWKLSAVEIEKGV